MMFFLSNNGYNILPRIQLKYLRGILSREFGLTKQKIEPLYGYKIFSPDM
tara:strand:+ start:4413 stop:4562 length:150 start_codon:yes stop_codon:yes gene_type:complete